MNMKKWLLTGACISMLGAFSACSDDPTSPKPDSSASEPTSADNQGSSSDVLASSGGNPGSSSSIAAPVSSSIADTDEPQMACSEIMYNAAEGSALEWVEFYIAGGKDIDNMAEYQMHLSGAVDFTFPAEPLAKGEYVIATNDVAAFKTAYPSFTGRVFGPWTGKLVNEGDVVNVKIRGEGDVTCAFGNEPPWPSLADGKGRSLVYLGGNAAQPNSWGASAEVNGKPGVGNDVAISAATVRINEIKPYVSDADPSWIELYNTGDEPVDVTGWTVEAKVRKDTLTIKAGVIAPKGYLVLNGATDFDNELIVSSQGGEFYLRGPLEGEESSLWVPANTGTSGVIDLADGSTAQGPLSIATPGAVNAPLQVGSVFINEIYYNPKADGLVRFEFMELVNGGAQDVALSNEYGSWKVEGINLQFPVNSVIPANSMVLLLSDTLAGDTGWVRSNYGVDPSVQIILYKGKLSNRGETIAVKEPYSKSCSATTLTTNAKCYYIWHDATLYSDSWPNLKEADGMGYSLQRKDMTTMGYESTAWIAAEPTPGK